MNYKKFRGKAGVKSVSNAFKKSGREALACGVAVGSYFLLKPYFGTETLSWMCILEAAPFAAISFIRYNSMTAELIWV